MAKKREEFFLKNGSLLLEKLVSSLNGKSNPIRNFSIKELEQATNRYNTSLIFDSWTYSDWYKGSLEGRFLSVRKFREVEDGILDSVIKEITFATQLSTHRNVLKLLGCCLETQTPVLVYEYPANGLEPLYDLIHPGGGKSRQHLPWKSRLRIAGEIANVIAYLHTAFPTPIIHREVTLCFCFLDQDCVPKLSNFFFAIALPKGRKYVVDTVMGVVGFIDPEYEMTGMVTEKVDVFSFGKLLLELLTGQRTIDFGPSANDGEFLRLIGVKTCLEDHKLDGFVDASILPGGGEIQEEQQLLAVTKLALRCISTAAENRPTMVEIAKELRGLQRDIHSVVTSTPTSSSSLTAPMIQVNNPLNQLIPVKLDDTNYLIWKYQVQTAIRGYGLEGFVLGTQAVPPELIQVEDGTQMVNPSYITYQRQDRLLASWILASMSPSFLPQLVGCDTARDIWNTVDRLFTFQSRANITDHQNQLQTPKRGMIKRHVYDALLLASKSNKIQQITAATPNEAQFHNSKTHQGEGQSSSGPSGHGKDKSKSRDDDMPKCQLCGEMGHTVLKCCYRFDKSFTGLNNGIDSSNVSSSST